MSETGSERVRGEYLRRLRKSKFSSAEAFAAACGSVSTQTVYRAERGGPVLLPYLARMAETLGIEADKLIFRDAPVDRIATDNVLNGKWWGIFVETDFLGRPVVNEENLELFQDGTQVTGRSVVNSDANDRIEIIENCQFKDNVLYGQARPEDWEFPLDCCAFVLSGSRDINLLQGYTTWFDFDSEMVEVCRYTLLRKGSPNFEAYQSELRKQSTNELRLFRLRRLMAAGCDLDEFTLANAMR